MKLNIAIVNAPALGIVEPWYDTPEFPRGALAVLAGYLRERKDYNIYCIDAKLERLSFEKTLERLKDLKCDIIGFTAFTNEIKPCGYLAYKIKELLPDCITVVGGSQVSALPIATLKEFPGIDIVCVGDGEETLLEICETVEQEIPIDSFDHIKGICFRKTDGEIAINPARNRIINQDSVAMPAWDLMPRGNHYWLQTSKGCPFHCVFCMNHNGRVVRKNSIDKTMDEIRFVIENYQPEWIRFGDEMFTADRNRTILFLEKWIENGFHKKVKWDAQTHVKYVDKEILALLLKANISRLDMGIESGDDRILKKMGKGTNEDLILKAFSLAHSMGVKTGSLLLLGQPNETKESINKTIGLAIKINSSIPMFGIMLPLPGTEVARLAATQQGAYKYMSFDWDEYSKNTGTAIEFENFSRKHIERAQFVGFLKVFLYNGRMLDLLKFVWEHRVEGWFIFKKMFKLKTQDAQKRPRPNDYDEIMSIGQRPNAHDIVSGLDEFEQIQKSEQKRTSIEAPHLIREQVSYKEVS